MADGLDLTLQSVANLSLAVLLGGVAGGVVSALVVGATWWIDSRARTLRELLLQGLQVHAGYRRGLNCTRIRRGCRKNPHIRRV